MLDVREVLRELDSTPDDLVKFDFPMKAAVLVRRQARLLLEAWNLDTGVSVSYRETRGLLTSSFMVHFSGPAREGARLIRALQRLG